ncbi:hypothetical protein KY306_03470 [Candidatus Woesearchaeota archaeon]|nr:hypothetical protein [Candidatus Woesearchaeota archaeon]
MVIKTLKNKVVLLSRKTKRVLGSWGFTTETGKKRAKAKALKRERQIQFFKHR